MIIRDLEHYEIGSQNYVEEIRGAGAITAFTFDSLAASVVDSISQVDIDLIATTAGGVSLSGISVKAALVAV